MVVRRLQYIVNCNGITPATEQFAGSQGDKSATMLDFALTDDLLGLVNQENIYYRFDGYDAEGNVLRGDSAPLDSNNLSYVLSEQLTRYGGRIFVYLIITKSVEGKTEMELYNFPARMRLNSLPSGGDIDKAEYESLTALAESAKGAADKLFGDNVFVFGGGNAYDENIWPPTTDEVHNPETHLVQSKRPITSKGVYAAFKAFYERIIQPIKDYIVEENTTEGGWTYRKWNSGIAECWGIFKYSTHQSYESVSDGSVYYHYEDIALPFEFVESPCATFSATSGKGFSHPVRINATVNTLRWYLQTNEDNVEMRIYFQVKGRWK